MKEVFIAGLASEYCVKETTLDARRLSFPTTVINGACRAVDANPGEGEEALEGRDLDHPFHDLGWPVTIFAVSAPGGSADALRGEVHHGTRVTSTGVYLAADRRGAWRGPMTGRWR